MAPEAWNNPFDPLPGSTPESGDLASDPEIAGRDTRFWARLVDGLAFWGPSTLGLILGVVQNESDMKTLAVAIGGLTSMGVGCAQVYLIGSRGQSIGKILMGLRVVNADGAHPGWVRTLLVREGARLLLGIMPYVGGIISLIDACMIFRYHRRTWHDQIAGTFVVKA